MNYKEATEYVESLQGYGCVPGLESIRQLCSYLGNPQDSLKFVHIAGTNGKGSVLAYVSTILTDAGYKVGRYISPTITDYRERFQIDGRMISKQGFCKYLEPVKEAAERMVLDGKPHPTPFEIETAIAFLYFLDKRCDIVIIETGMGGALDATNIIKTPICVAFTSISMDHMAYLGSSLEEIAANKAGIIKENIPVVSVLQKPEAAKVIENEAGAKNCNLIIADPDKAVNIKYGLTKQTFSYGRYKKIEISIPGKYQIHNAVTAVEIIDVLKEKGFQVSDEALRTGFAKTKWPGRFEIIGKKPLFIADGAHNEDAALKLAQSISFYFTNKRIIYIMGVLRDKDYNSVISTTYQYAEQIITVTPPASPRALSGYELANVVREYHNSVTVADSMLEAVELAYLLTGKDKDTVIIAFGSLSFIGELTNIVEHRDMIRRDSHGKSEEN
ncbi:MAG: bifunctional folylpolyglutamate synthase/dihydrofolate synthase [Lachnospiraceae bacterium]|nr:bifunctional folylpolyglutamate synthase/dihydrofolate synthase [Lachnospiraceae bacterium]